MADQDLQMDVDAEEKKSSPLILIIIIVVVLLLAGGGAAFFLLGGDDSPTEEVAPQNVIKPAIYMPLRPSFVINFANVGGKNHFLQVEVTLMGREPGTMSKLEEHMPLIKSKLVDVFQTQEFEELKTPEGKEAMRTMALEELQALFSEELGDVVIEKIYFTVFILQ